jgi:hypothetical protein
MSTRDPFGDFDFTRDVDGMFSSRADNIFLAKVSYWFRRKQRCTFPS